MISLTISLSFSDYLPTYLPIYLSLSLSLSIYLSLHLSIYCCCSCSCCGWCCCCCCCCCCCLLVRHLHVKKGSLLTSKCASRHNGVHFFDTSSTSEPPKVVRDRQFLTLLTWKCASRHNGVHFFDIATSKSGPELRCFVHFDLEMCFAPQRRALFRHLNFQKWSDNGVFCTF